MVTMNSEKSACRRKPAEKNSSSSSSSKKAAEPAEETDKKNEDNRTSESPDLSPNTPTYNVTASCAEDTPNYLVYKKVRSQIKRAINNKERMCIVCAGKPIQEMQHWHAKTI